MVTVCITQNVPHWAISFAGQTDVLAALDYAIERAERRGATRIGPRRWTLPDGGEIRIFTKAAERAKFERAWRASRRAG